MAASLMTSAPRWQTKCTPSSRPLSLSATILTVPAVLPVMCPFGNSRDRQHAGHDRKSRRPGSLFGIADGSQLRIGKNRHRYCCVIHAAPAAGVEHVFYRHNTFPSPDRGNHHPSGNITGRPDSRCRGAHPVIHLDKAAGIHRNPCVFQANSGGCRGCADCHQERVLLQIHAGYRLPRQTRSFCPLIFAPNRLPHRGRSPPPRHQRLLQRASRLPLQARQYLRPVLQNGHGGSETVIHLAQFKGDCSPPIMTQ